MRRLSRLATAIVAIGALAVPGAASAADHLDSPSVQSNGAIDINDLYVFEGSDPANTVLSFTVNPAAGMISGTAFDADASYDILVDTDGDAVEDLTYTFDFAPEAAGAQAFTVSLDGTEIAAGETGTGVSIGTGGQVFAGLVDDPFFFDLEGFQQLKSTLLEAGTLEDAISLICDTDPDVNFFAGFNASALVLEVPDGDLGGTINVWAETNSGGTQLDRMGKPGINTVFLTGDAAKDGYNAAEPANDAAEYTDEVSGITSAIQQALGVAEADANAYGDTVAGILLPDVLPYDTSMAADFSAFNGRALADDVIDVYYQVLTTVEDEPALTGDCVANDSAFRDTFPYYAVANEATAPASPSTPAQMPNTSIGEAVPTTGAIPAALVAVALLLVVSASGLTVAVARKSRSR